MSEYFEKSMENYIATYNEKMSNENSETTWEDIHELKSHLVSVTLMEHGYEFKDKNWIKKQ